MNTVPTKPMPLQGKEYSYQCFQNGQVLLNKKKNHLPAMGWNSWNAFGSGNTEALTKAMGDALVELGLDQLGYQYVVLDDGCYCPERVDGKLCNEPVKFPDDFRVLADYLHDKGLKFGMYNDIGTNLCAGALVGTCGFEETDAQSYVDWGVDFLKVDNCYYLWDNATFSNWKNARYVYAPWIYQLDLGKKIYSVEDATLLGRGVVIQDGHAENIGSFDGTGPDNTPLGEQFGGLLFEIEVPADGEYELAILYQASCVNGKGNWLQILVGEGETAELVYDDFVAEDEKLLKLMNYMGTKTITLPLKAGKNQVSLVNHRRQENTLNSYALLLEGLNKADPNHDIIYSMCEWGKTQPQNWAKKVGDSWRILNDITFMVGRDGDPGQGRWESDYTTGITSQYNKAVIMDEYAGLDKGWNDPDMMMIGMNGLTLSMNRTHMAMWCMMNSPLMLGMDLRRVKKGDELYNIIANRELIALNQDPLGKQAVRCVYFMGDGNEKCTAKEYIRDNNRVDILAKPLADGSLALSFINLSEAEKTGDFQITLEELLQTIGEALPARDCFKNAKSFTIRDLWTGQETVNETGIFGVTALPACENVTIRVYAR